MALLNRYEPAALSTWVDDFFNEGFVPRALSGNYPVVEVREEKDHYLLTAEMAGLNKEDIAVTVKNGVLTLSGEKKHEKRDEQKGYFYSERSYGRFERSFNLSENIEESDVDATYTDGVLKVTLKKRPETKPRQIAVK